MAHESTFAITFGTVPLVSKGDLIESEVGLSRTPVAPTAAPRPRASAIKLYHGLNLSHSLGWTIRREFETIAHARAYQWTRPAQLPEGRQTITINDSGYTVTLADAHLTQFDLSHGKPCVIFETVAVVGGYYSVQGATEEPDWPEISDSPNVQPVPGLDWILSTGTWRDSARWKDAATWQEN